MSDGSLRQHINLFAQLERKVDPPFSARQQLWALAGVLVVLAGSWAYLQQQQIQSAKAVARVETKQKQSKQALERTFAGTLPGRPEFKCEWIETSSA